MSYRPCYVRLPNLAVSVLLILASVLPARADNDRMEGNVITYVCKVDVMFKAKNGETFVGTSCIDGKSRCNDQPNSGYCAPGGTGAGVSKACSWVALSMCRSQ
jgi:hypothetical protein